MRNIFKEKEYIEELKVFGWISLVVVITASIIIGSAFLIPFLSSLIGLTGAWDIIFCIVMCFVFIAIGFFVGHMILYTIQDKII